jgi:hypothetical protein
MRTTTMTNEPPFDSDVDADAVCTCTDDTVCANCAECIEIEHLGGWWPDAE